MYNTISWCRNTNGIYTRNECCSLPSLLKTSTFSNKDCEKHFRICMPTGSKAIRHHKYSNNFHKTNNTHRRHCSDRYKKPLGSSERFGLKKIMLSSLGRRFHHSCISVGGWYRATKKAEIILHYFRLRRKIYNRREFPDYLPLYISS